MESNTFNITISELEFHGYHGVSLAEKELGIKMTADIEAEVDIPGNSDLDSIDSVLNYTELAQFFLDCQSAQSYNTLEALAFEFCYQALNNFAKIEAISIHIQKPTPPTPIPAQALGVQFSLSRN